MRIDDERRRGEEHSSQDEQVGRILEAHRMGVQTLLDLRDKVAATIQEDPTSSSDPSGWRLYAYNPEDISQEELEYVPGSIAEALAGPPHPTPVWELSYSAPNQQNYRGDTLPESFVVNAPGITSHPIHVELFPMGGNFPTEWSRVSVDLSSLSTRPSVTRERVFPEVYSEIDHREPEFPSHSRRDDVLLFGVSAQDVERAMDIGEREHAHLARFAKEMTLGRLRASIFGNTHNTGMKPQFIRPLPQLNQ